MGNRVSHFKTKLLAMFLIDDYFVIILIFIKHFCSLFQLYEFYFSSTVFHFSSDDDLFDFLVLVSREPFLTFCMAWSLIYLFICFSLIICICCFFPASIALMVLSSFLPPCSLMRSSTTVFLCHSTHPVCASFLSFSVFLASGVKLYCEKLSASKNGVNI